ncbi:MAG: hypothetical protein K0Q50_1565 [Vampirovibrio sp.]|jgi:hypothetical protein|nr:hypothetical protein [Vampirovibrio sp.]
MNFMKFFHALGDEGPKTALAVIAANCLALATIRPLITLLNPHEQPAKKKYAALRESLTELIAVPVVVGMGILFKSHVSPVFFQKQSPEINKDVIRKLSSVTGITIGNLTVPFVATTAIGVLLKVFPSLATGPKTPLAEHSPTNVFTDIERGLVRSTPKKLLLPASHYGYNVFNPVYRAPYL